jgi:magnesium transporter
VVAAQRRREKPMTETVDKNNETLEVDVVKDEIAEAHSLLVQYRLLETTMRQDEIAPEEIEKSLAQTPCLVELRELLNRLPTVTVALILNSLSDEDRLVAWSEIAEERVDPILELLSEEISEELVTEGDHTSSKESVNAFELQNGRLRQITVEGPQQLTKTKPIWVDLVAPTPQVRAWVGKFFGLELPDPEELTDLEASARFYVDENDEVHLQSDFLLDLEDESRNVPVAFILHRGILFSVRSEELPVFRLLRLRARRQPGYVTDGKDVLLDLYAADAEYSADALEDVYAELEAVGKNVLNTSLSDEVAGNILADIAREEDLNGRIRRNVLDDRRAVSSLMRGKFLSADQQEDARQILRDIESLDGHTSFLFGKINFLMDAVVGFINVNQNQRVSKLTKLGIIFMPINVLAGIGGMSEFSMMTSGIDWPIAYGGFALGMGLIGWVTYWALRQAERREARRQQEETVPERQVRQGRRRAA